MKGNKKSHFSPFDEDDYRISAVFRPLAVYQVTPVGRDEARDERRPFRKAERAIAEHDSFELGEPFPSLQRVAPTSVGSAQIELLAAVEIAARQPALSHGFRREKELLELRDRYNLRRHDETHRAA